MSAQHGLDDSFGDVSETNYRITSPYRQNPKPSYPDLEQEYNRLRRINFDLKLRLLTLEEQLQSLGLGEEIPGMVMEVTGLRSNLKSLQAENRNLRDLKDQQELTILRSKTAADSLRADVSSLEAVLATKDNEIANIRKANTDLQATLISKSPEGHNQALQDSIKSLESELSNTITTHKQHLTTCKYDKELLERELREVKERYQQSKLITFDRKDTDVVDLQEKLSEALKEIQQLEMTHSSDYLLSTPKSNSVLDETPPAAKQIITQQRDEITELHATLISFEREFTAKEKSLKRDHKIASNNLKSDIFKLNEELVLVNNKNDRSVELLSEYQLIFEANQRAIESGEQEIGSLQRDFIELEERYQEAVQQRSSIANDEIQEVEQKAESLAASCKSVSLSRAPSSKRSEQVVFLDTVDPFENSQLLEESTHSQNNPNDKTVESDFDGDRRKTIPVFQFPPNGQGLSPNATLMERRRSTRSPEGTRLLKLDASLLRSPMSDSRHQTPTGSQRSPLHALDLDRSISMASVKSSKKGSPLRSPLRGIDFGTSPMSRPLSRQSSARTPKGITMATSPMALSDINDRLSRSLSQRSLRSQQNSPSARSNRDFVTAGTSPLRYQHLDATTSPLRSSGHDMCTSPMKPLTGHDMCTSPMKPSSPSHSQPRTPRKTVSASAMSSPAISEFRCDTPSNRRTLTPLPGSQSPSVSQPVRTLSPLNRSAFYGQEPPSPREAKKTLSPLMRANSGRDHSFTNRTLSPLTRTQSAHRTLSPMHRPVSPKAVNRTLTPRHQASEMEPVPRTLSQRGLGSPKASNMSMGITRCESTTSMRSQRTPVTPRERKERDQEIIFGLQQVIDKQNTEHEELLAELADTTQQLSDAQSLVFAYDEMRATTSKLLESLGVSSSGSDDCTLVVNSFVDQITSFRNNLQTIPPLLETPITTIEQAVTMLSQKYEISISNLSSKLKRLSLYVQKNTEKDSEMAILKQYVGRLETELDEQRETLLLLEEGKLKTEFEISKLNTTTAVSKSTIEHLTEELDHKRNEIHDLTQNKNNLEIEQASLNDQLSDVKQQVRLLKESNVGIRTGTIQEQPPDSQITLRIGSLMSTVETGFNNLKQFLKECGWGKETLGLSRNFLDSIQTCTSRSEEVLKEIHALAKQATVMNSQQIIAPKEMSPQRSRSAGSTPSESCHHAVVAKHESQTVELMISRLTSLNETLKHHSTQRDISFRNIMQRLHTMEQTIASQLSLIFGIASPKRARSRSPVRHNNNNNNNNTQSFQPSGTTPRRGSYQHNPSMQKPNSQLSYIDPPSPFRSTPAVELASVQYGGGWNHQENNNVPGRYINQCGNSSIISAEPLHRSISPIQHHIETLCSNEIQRIEQIGNHWDGY